MGFLMDVKDYSQSLNQNRERYRAAEDDLRSSYDKNTDDMKQTFEQKTQKLGKNYDGQKSKLEEQNNINNKLYSDKTKETIALNQERFRNDIKKNADRFDADRQDMKDIFHDKLTSLSNSYNKSTIDNDHFHTQAEAAMKERYLNTNKDYKESFDAQTKKVEDKASEQYSNIIKNNKDERSEKDNEYQNNLDNLLNSNQEKKLDQIAHLNSDNENLRNNFESERETMTQQKEDRIADFLKIKSEENEDRHKNLSNLENNIRRKSIDEEKKVNNTHQFESKTLDKKYKNEIRNIGQLYNQKMRNGNEVASLKDENKQLVNTYEKRLLANRSDTERSMEIMRKKEMLNENVTKEKLKYNKAENSQALDNQEVVFNSQHIKDISLGREKANNLVDRFKKEIENTKIDTEENLSKIDEKSKKQLNSQRVEFGKYINTINDKNIQEITSVKSELSKDKSNFIEKSKRENNAEKNILKDQFHHQISARNDTYEKKLLEMENQTNKIIGNYESRINQITRKVEKEVDIMKSNEEERKIKDMSAQKISYENIKADNQIELEKIRNKYESMIGNDRISKEQQTNTLVQKYEDQLEKERISHQKEISTTKGDAQIQMERLFKSAELEKETLRNQFEERLESIKNSVPLKKT